MNDGQFKKGIEELKSIRMTNKEKSRMLSEIFSLPIKSPYMKKPPAFAFIYSSHYAKVALTSCFVIVLSFGGVVYASGNTIPGDLFYPIKTKLVEPVLDVVNSSPEKKIVWEKEKIERRIVEAEKLADQDELDEKRAQELEDNIEKSSIAFIETVNANASSTAVSAKSSKEKMENLKREFRKKVSDDIDSEIEIRVNLDLEQDKVRERKDNPNRKRVRELRSKVIKVLDDYDKSESGKTDDDDSNDDDAGEDDKSLEGSDDDRDDESPLKDGIKIEVKFD